MPQGSSAVRPTDSLYLFTFWQYCLSVPARSLYTFRTLSASIIRSTKNCSSSHWCMSWVGM